MAKIIALIRDDIKRKDGLKTVFIKTTCKGQCLRFNTNILVHPDEWDPAGFINGNTQKIKDDNLHIRNCIARLNNIFVKYRLQYKELTPGLIRKEYNNPTLDVDFYAFWEAEMKDKKEDVEHTTWEQHCSVLKKLRKFRTTCYFSELDKQFLLEFQRFCKKYKNGKKEIKNNQNTINKNLKTIKVYVNLALEQEKIKKSPFADLKIKRQHPDIVFLEPSELLNIIEKFKKNLFSTIYHETLRRYLFSCFTGLRISDSLELKYENIIQTTLVVKPHKTKGFVKIVRIPLTFPALDLLGDCSKTGLVFSKKSEQAINRDLKNIADLCGIYKKIRFHSARHTFATIYYRSTRDIVGLKELLGHSDIRYTMVYTHIVPLDTEENIKELDKFWH